VEVPAVDMPRRASGGVKKQKRDSPPTELHDTQYKEDPSTPNDSIYHIKDTSTTEKTAPDRIQPWIESRCMCVGGLLPQHIRSLISTYHLTMHPQLVLETNQLTNSSV